MTEKIIENLKNKEDINPDNYDGSYELVRATVKALNNIDFEDLNYIEKDNYWRD